MCRVLPIPLAWVEIVDVVVVVNVISQQPPRATKVDPLLLLHTVVVALVAIMILRVAEEEKAVVVVEREKRLSAYGEDLYRVVAVRVVVFAEAVHKSPGLRRQSDTDEKVA